MTSQPTEPNYIQQTLFAEAFPVKTSQLQGKAKASRRLQGLVFGFNSSEPYAWYDQNTSSWKTYQRSLLTDWTSFSGTFTRQGYMNANGVVYQAALLELATKEIVFGSSDSLPTPTTMDHLDQRSLEALKRQMDGPRKGRTQLGTLREAVNPQTQEMFNSLLPTPRANSTMSQNLNISSIKNHPHRNLETVVSQLPTPRAAIGMGMKISKGMANLEHKKYLETEIAAKVHTHGEVQNIDSTQIGDNMYLNPAFCEEMMGYEIGWTDLKH